MVGGLLIEWSWTALLFALHSFAQMEDPKDPGKDYDVEIYGVSADALEKAIAENYALSRVGISFGVFKVHGHEIDIALPRTENKVGAGHRGFIVDTNPDLSFEEATARRDFTINAIMYACLELF